MVIRAEPIRIDPVKLIKKRLGGNEKHEHHEDSHKLKHHSRPKQREKSRSGSRSKSRSRSRSRSKSNSRKRRIYVEQKRKEIKNVPDSIDQWVLSKIGTKNAENGNKIVGADEKAVFKSVKNYKIIDGKKKRIILSRVNANDAVRSRLSPYFGKKALYSNQTKSPDFDLNKFKEAVNKKLDSGEKKEKVGKRTVSRKKKSDVSETSEDGEVEEDIGKNELKTLLGEQLETLSYANL